MDKICSFFFLSKSSKNSSIHDILGQFCPSISNHEWSVKFHSQSPQFKLMLTIHCSLLDACWVLSNRKWAVFCVAPSIESLIKLPSKLRKSSISQDKLSFLTCFRFSMQNCGNSSPYSNEILQFHANSSHNSNLFPSTFPRIFAILDRECAAKRLLTALTHVLACVAHGSVAAWNVCASTIDSEISTISMDMESVVHVPSLRMYFCWTGIVYRVFFSSIYRALFSSGFCRIAGEFLCLIH